MGLGLFLLGQRLSEAVRGCERLSDVLRFFEPEKDLVVRWLVQVHPERYLPCVENGHEGSVPERRNGT